MAWKLLPTDFTDAVWEGLKKYTQIDNPDGTVSFQDVTAYTNKEKSFFGAMQANRMNDTLNVIMSMLENGTDLYELFQQYFEKQKNLFSKKAADEYTGFEAYVTTHQSEIDTIVSDIRTNTDNEYASFQRYVAEHQEQIDTIVEAIRTSTDNKYNEFEADVDARKKEIADIVIAIGTSTDKAYADFLEYVQNLEKQGDDAIAGIKTDYRQEMDEYQATQERLFEVWFDAIRERLSGDIATSLQDQIDNLNTKVDGFIPKTTVFSADGKTIVESEGNVQLTVTFNDDGSITEKQVRDGTVIHTKTTTFSPDGLTIKEEVT